MLNKPAARHVKTRKADNTAAAAARVKRKTRKAHAPKTAINAPVHSFKEKLLFFTIELIALASITLYAIISVLAYTATWFSGTNLLSNLLPFAMGVLALIVMCTLFYIVWWHLRKFLLSHSPVLIPMTALALVLAVVLIPDHNKFFQSLNQFRTLVGRKPARKP